MPPQAVKDTFYKTFQSPDNYKKLIIKENNETVDKLRDIFKNNVWGLEAKAQELKKVNRAENKDNYNSWLNGVYLLDFRTKPKLKNISRKTFFNLGYKGDTTDRNELNYISHYKTWINQFFIEKQDIDNINWFCQNQNEVLLTLMTQRNARNNSLETLRKDLNLLLHFCKIAEADVEIINKFKVLNIALSLIHNLKEGENKLDENEEKKYIKYDDLIELQKKLYRDWEQAYEQQIITKKKDPGIRYKNIKALLLAMYTLFPPLRLEALGLRIVNSEADALKYDNAIYIKNRANIWVYLNTIKKQHKAIKYNLSDPIIKSFSGDNVDKLIEMIIESVKLYPREFMFINTDNNLYSEKGLQKMLYDLLPDKNLGVNAIRSIYASHYMPKINTNQAKRLAFLMRSSVSVLTGSYVKKSIDNQTVVIQPEPRAEVEIEIKNTPSKLRDRKAYLKAYYEQNKQKIIDSIKVTDKRSQNKRFVRELTEGVILWKNIRASTKEKYKLKFDEKTNKYTSDL
jgi:hypothetical protein